MRATLVALLFLCVGAAQARAEEVREDARKDSVQSDGKRRGDCPEFRVWLGHNGKEGVVPWPDAKNRRYLTRFWTSF